MIKKFSNNMFDSSDVEFLELQEAIPELEKFLQSYIGDEVKLSVELEYDKYNDMIMVYLISENLVKTNTKNPILLVLFKEFRIIFIGHKNEEGGFWFTPGCDYYHMDDKHNGGYFLCARIDFEDGKWKEVDERSGKKTDLI